MDHEAYMREAIALAQEGMDHNHGGPFGAVIVRDGQVIGKGFNRVTELHDATAHAEVTAIRDAGDRTGTHSLQGADLYTSCQPCPMCLTAAFWAHIRQVFYAATEQDAADIGFDDAEFYRRLNFKFDAVEIPKIQLLQGEAAEVMRQWIVKKDRKHY